MACVWTLILYCCLKPSIALLYLPIINSQRGTGLPRFLTEIINLSVFCRSKSEATKFLYLEK